MLIARTIIAVDKQEQCILNYMYRLIFDIKLMYRSLWWITKFMRVATRKMHCTMKNLLSIQLRRKLFILFGEVKTWICQDFCLRWIWISFTPSSPVHCIWLTWHFFKILRSTVNVNTTNEFFVQTTFIMFVWSKCHRPLVTWFRRIQQTKYCTDVIRYKSVIYVTILKLVC